MVRILCSPALNRRFSLEARTDYQPLANAKCPGLLLPAQLTAPSEQAPPRIKQMRPGPFARQLGVAFHQRLQDSFVISRRSFMKRQFTPIGALASTANDACDLNQ